MKDNLERKRKKSKDKNESEEIEADDDENDEKLNKEIDEGLHGKDYIKLPHKSNYRMHAHCNPLSYIFTSYPLSPLCIDWSKHYPQVYEAPKNSYDELYINTDKFPITYNNDNFTPICTANPPKNFFNKPYVNIVDIGCGYGGLLFGMTEHLDKNDLALGMEIRDKVSNYVGERIKVLRYNSKYSKYNNISVIRANTMKLLLNYFYKDQLDKLFFCFADPHFKKYNHRKRIINKYLLNDYSYLLKKGGRLYIITDVEELHLWDVDIISQNPCFKELDRDTIEKDPFLKDMMDTDEARKVKKIKGKMFYTIYEKVDPVINSLDELYNTLKFTNDEE